MEYCAFGTASRSCWPRSRGDAIDSA
uniref:Uncharacterized protein n=1 Tax=Arundo donax TaxID=35708 RepID=A0A0A9BR41_ARUDO